MSSYALSKYEGLHHSVTVSLSLLLFCWINLNWRVITLIKEGSQSKWTVFPEKMNSGVFYVTGFGHWYSKSIVLWEMSCISFQIGYFDVLVDPDNHAVGEGESHTIYWGVIYWSNWIYSQHWISQNHIYACARYIFIVSLKTCHQWMWLVTCSLIYVSIKAKV